MICLQCFCIQFLLIIFANQVFSQPFEVIDNNNNNQNFIPLCGCFYGKAQIEQVPFDKDNNDQIENIGQNFLKLTKRRPQPKANLAGLWGVPTKFA